MRSYTHSTVYSPTCRTKGYKIKLVQELMSMAKLQSNYQKVVVIKT